MKISIIVPTYKPQSYIWECLASIRDQTFPKEDYELILVLNGCKEPYYTQIKNYINQNLLGYNINFIQTDIGGVSNARNIALDEVKGEYVTFIDDDDYISPKYLEGLYEKATPGKVTVARAIGFKDETRDIVKLFPSKELYEVQSTKSNLNIMEIRRRLNGPCSKLIHETLINNRRFNIEYKNGEDSLFCFLISDKMKNFAYASENAIYYRRYREGNATSQLKGKYIIKNRVKLIVEYAKIIMRHPLRYNWFFFFSTVLANIKTIIKK